MTDSDCSFFVDVTEADVHAFANLSGDHNPIHVNKKYASGTEFCTPIAHGVLILSYASRVLGMHLPGNKCIILGLSASFPNPVKYPTTLLIVGKMVRFGKVGRVRVTAQVESTGKFVMDALVDFTLQVSDEIVGARSAVSKALPVRGGKENGSRRLLVTGGTGGVGRHVVEQLGTSYDITCLTRSALFSGRESNVTYENVDLGDTVGLSDFLSNVDPSLYYGIVHMSAVHPEQALASDDPAHVLDQLNHSVVVPLMLCRWARSRSSSVRRVVLVGSQNGTRMPQPKVGAYSIAKGAMELLTTVLPTDLYTQQATFNVIALGATIVGMNADVSARSKARLASLSATGRTSEPEDVSALVAYVLSDAAAQLNGAVIPLDGGLLL